MQLHESHNLIYKSTASSCTQELEVSDSQKQIIYARNGLVELWGRLKAKSLSDDEITELIGISRATYYRYKSSFKKDGLQGLIPQSRRPRVLPKSKVGPSIRNIVHNLRLVNPTYGKAKIVVILRRDYNITISESTVGRILKHLILNGKIKRSISAVRIKRKRRFNSYAKMWNYDMKATAPGEMVQIDHMSVVKNGVSMKHFQAWDPITKVIVADVTSNATSLAAAKFLSKVIRDMPFKIKSVQVDGGSEFMKYFEEECSKLEIALYVLPPKRPQYNGGVERGNRIFREEFYAKKIYADSIGSFKHHLYKAVNKYNTYRPHFNLNGLTPIEYTQQILAA